MRLDGLQSEMQAMKLEATNSRPLATGQKVGADFGDMLSKAINGVNGLQKTSGDMQVRFDRGDENVSLYCALGAKNHN